MWRAGRGCPGPGLAEAAGWEREEGARSVTLAEGLARGLGRKKLQEHVFVVQVVETPFWCSCNFAQRDGLWERGRACAEGAD